MARDGLGINFDAVNANKLSKELSRLARKVNNFKPAFAAMGSDFYNYEKRIFQLKSPGKYKDLSPQTKIQKRKKFGFIYPILKATGALERSLTSKSAVGSVYRITPTSFLIGTSIQHGIYHQSTRARRKLPHRPFIIFRGKAEGSTVHTVTGGTMESRWINIARKYVERVLTGKTSIRLTG